MIEINIPEKAALNLLRDQVDLEFKRQKRLKYFEYNLQLGDLDEVELKAVVEIALFDILALLPVTLITEESNLPKIISKTIRVFSSEYNNRFLSHYSEKEAKRQISQIKAAFGEFGKTTTYQNN